MPQQEFGEDLPAVGIMNVYCQYAQPAESVFMINYIFGIGSSAILKFPHKIWLISHVFHFSLYLP